MRPFRTWLIALVIGALGYALNLLAIPLLPGLHLLLGAVTAYMAALAFGAGPGALAGAVAGARTAALWGHPWGWVLLTLEAAAVGLLRKRLRPVWAIGLFWLVLGDWIGFLAYRVLLHLPLFMTIIGILKQALNGLLNALLAEAVLLAAPVRRALRLPDRPPLRQFLGVLAALGATIPLLAVWMVGMHQQMDAALETATSESRVNARLFARALADSWQNGQMRPDRGELMVLQMPGGRLRALRPDGVVLRVTPAGTLVAEAPETASYAAGATRSLLAGQPRKTWVYTTPGTQHLPFLRNYQQTLIAAERVNGTGWVVWSEMPFAQILAPLNRRVTRGEVVMIAALLAALLLAVLVARQLEQPIGALVTATERLTAGELNARVGPSAYDHGPAEPALLARRLDAMAARIEEAEGERAQLLASERAAREQAERRATEERALRRATQAVTETSTVEEVIRRIAVNALAATNADGAYVERLDARTRTVIVAAVAGDVHQALGAVRPLAGSYMQAALDTGEPLLIPEIGEADRPLPAGISEQCPDCAAAVVPLLESGSAIGALLLLRHGGNGFSADEVYRAVTFANLAALAFRKVRLLEESEQRRGELERVMESRARLIRGFSHDLKNPLGAADGYLQLLQEDVLGQLSTRQRESVQHVRRSLQAAIALIGDLIELARAEAGQLDVQIHTVDPRAVARDMAGEYRAEAEAAGLSLEEQIPDPFPLVHSDERRVRQVLGNMLSNAVKYTPRGGRIGVRVSLREGSEVPAPGEWVAMDVWDTGQGIRPEDRDRIFQEFTRLEAARTPGAGLGLAISRRVARAIAGELSFVSQPGQGSTFTLWLPRHH